jgi:hypothetical protein
MKLTGLSLVAALGMVVMGCAGDPPSSLYIPGGGDPNHNPDGSGPTTSGPLPEDPQQMWTERVYPSLMQTCGECHVAGGVGTPYYLASDAMQAYTLVKGLPGYVTDPATSRLVLKGVHYANKAPALTSDQKTLVTDWLNKELAANPGNPGDPVALTPIQELERFGKCMSFTDWEQFNVVELSNQQAIYQNNSVECDSCHQNGTGGTYIQAESDQMFMHTQTIPYILKFAAATLNTDGTFKDIAKTNRWIEKCVEEQLVGNPHPPCQNEQIDPLVAESINLFFDATYQRWADNKCEEAVPPPPPGQ